MADQIPRYLSKFSKVKDRDQNNNSSSNKSQREKKQNYNNIFREMR